MKRARGKPGHFMEPMGESHGQAYPSTARRSRDHGRAFESRIQEAGMTGKWVQIRLVGDSVAVDTSYARQIYMASPIGEYPMTPYQRAEHYIASLIRDGYDRKPDIGVQS